MFKSSINALSLKNAIDAVSVVIEEARIHYSAAGILVKAVDHATVAMVYLDIKASAFKTFSADDGVIAISMVRLYEIISMANDTSIIEMCLNEDSRKLEIAFDGGFYSLALLDPASLMKEPKLPVLDLPANFIVRSEHIVKAIKAAIKINSDTNDVSFGMTDKAFYIETVGNLDSMRYEVPVKDLTQATFKNCCKSLLSIDYMNDFIKAIGKTDAVAIKLGTDYPVTFTFNVAGANGQVTYLIAPRIGE